MISAENIYNEIQAMQNPRDEQYLLFKIELLETEVYYGKNSEGQSVFAMESQNPKLRTSIQKTKKLLFWFNTRCNIVDDGNRVQKTMNVLACLSDDEDENIAFVRLTMAFIGNADEKSPKRMHELFAVLTNLFACAYRASQIELQGFYAELYAIRHFYSMDLNLSDLWQRKEKMTFDFSVSAQKKIEVKSTMKELRVHHFRHEQLLSDLYDICVISIMLRADDRGSSLLNLVQDVRKIAAKNFDALVYIEDFIKNFDDAELDSVKFDDGYSERNLHVYQAENIPRFEKGQPRGVSKVEYDSDLSTSKPMSNEDFVLWYKS